MLSGVVDSAMDAIIAIDEEHRVVLFNAAAEKMFGCPAEDALGKSIERFIPERFRAGHAGHIRSFRGSGTTSRALGKLGTLWALRSNGEEFPIEASVSHVETASKDLFTVILRDVTERHQQEEARRQSEEWLQMAVHAGRMYAYEWDGATDTIIRSANYVDVLGSSERMRTTRQELLAQIHPDDRALMMAHLASLTPEKPTSHVSYRMLRPDGGVLWVEKRARATFNSEGKLLRTVGVVVDVTPRKQAEEAQVLHSAIVESSDDAIFFRDMNGIIRSWNAAAQGIFGFSESEAIGQPISILIPPEMREEQNRILQIINRGESLTHYETVRMTKDNKRVDVSLTISPVRDSASNMIGASVIARDISERKRVEARLRESEQRFRRVANTAPIMIWMSGVDKLCTYFNQPWLDFTGRPLEAELGHGWAEGVHPEDLMACMDTYTRMFDARLPFAMQYRLRRNDGEYRWIIDRGVPRYNADGSFAGYIGSCSDITDHKLAEEALSNVSQRLLEAAEEERTRIARELHDDINQRIALLAIELDQSKQELSVADVETFRRIRKACKTLTEIGKDIQAISHRLHSSKLEYLGITAAANSLCRELSEQQNVQIDFQHSDIPRDLPHDISLCLFRVMQEALFNAVKHSGVRQVKVELHGAANEMQLTVSDTGIGFDPETVASGHGLGLISMQERLHLVKGSFSIDSKPKRGTTIQARIPLDSQGSSRQSASTFQRAV